MNTKTMRLPPRRVSMLNNNKRKKRDDFDLKHLTPPHPPAPPPPPTKLSKPNVPLAGFDQAAHPPLALPNQLLAGYLAHEFLTRRTLFGQPWDPARPQQTAVVDSKTGTREEAEPSERSREGDTQPKPKPHQMYVEVASLLKADGAHIPDIVNPSQLARLLQM